MANQYNLFFSVLLLATTTTAFKIKASDVTAEFAKDRLYVDYIKKLHALAGDVQVTNIYNMLKMYSESTLEQTHQVVEYLQTHSNLTREEGKSLRMAGNSSVKISDCIRSGELKILGAYRNTGYNLHNCIRSAQMSFEKSYADLNTKIEMFKIKVIGTFNHYNSTVDNCVDQNCWVQTLAEALVQYEKLNDELSNEIMEGNNLNSRYILNSIAMTCVSNSITQISQNYNTGKELLANCFHTTQQASSTNPQQGQYNNAQQGQKNNAQPSQNSLQPGQYNRHQTSNVDNNNQQSNNGQQATRPNEGIHSYGHHQNNQGQHGQYNYGQQRQTQYQQQQSRQNNQYYGV